MKTARPTIVSTIRRTMYGALAVLSLILWPAPYAFADGVDTTSSASASCSPVSTPPSGLQRPNGADSATYTYNSCTGLWENPHFTWSPVTKLTTPKDAFIYSCDTTNWNWQYKTWAYSPARGTFFQVTNVTGQLPAGAVIAGDSVVPCAPSSIANTGPDSTNTIVDATSSTTDLNNTTNAGLNNQLGSTAVSGDATVASNTHGGSAVSGSAGAMANVVNCIMVATNVNVLCNALQAAATPNGAVATFTADINGDVQGNLIIDPSQLQPASNAPALDNGALTINNETNGQINNDIKLTAASGNAAVAKNTTAGSATSGNATAIANVVNMLNSIVSAGKSFVGVINVHGNVNGDILMPQSFLDSLVASNAPNTTLALSAGEANSLGITNTNNLDTTNTVTSSAVSGNASVTGNTNAGSATSGAASTQVRVFNLTGSQVVGANCLLVFVNVSGKWVGVIMNAPSGTTAAAFGSGITQNGQDTNITNTVNGSITNDIGVSATSGDAAVTDNTIAGNATSGSANTAVNLLNMNNSAFNLTGWFGVLFINIFGNWYGDFRAVPQTTPPAADTTPVTHSTPKPKVVFQFVSDAGTTSYAAAPTSSTDTTVTGVQLASATHKVLGAIAGDKQVQNSKYVSQIISGLVVLFGVGLFAAERYVSKRQAHRSPA